MKCLFLLMLMLLNVKLQASDFDKWTNKYDLLLQNNVITVTADGVESTVVDYRALSQSEQVNILFEKLPLLPDPTTLKRDHELAFWINVYNFLTLYMVAQKPTIHKLTDLNGLFKNVWKLDAGVVAGEMVTLDQIEHEIIRKKFKEPRIHVAVVCAAFSCPDLRAGAYRGEVLDSQLSEQLGIFAANSFKGVKVVEQEEIIYLSQIFNWFAGDFGEVKKWLFSQGLISREVSLSYEIKFLDYNWNLNRK